MAFQHSATSLNGPVAPLPVVAEEQTAQPQSRAGAGEQSASSSPSMTSGHNVGGQTLPRPPSTEEAAQQRAEAATQAKAERRSYFRNMSTTALRTLKETLKSQPKPLPVSKAVSEPWFAAGVRKLNENRLASQATKKGPEEDGLDSLYKNMTFSPDGAYCISGNRLLAWDYVLKIWRPIKANAKLAVLGANKKLNVVSRNGVLMELDAHGHMSNDFPPVSLPKDTSEIAVSVQGSVAMLANERPGKIGFLPFNKRKKDVSDYSKYIKWFDLPTAAGPDGKNIDVNSMVFGMDGKLTLLDKSGALWEGKIPSGKEAESIQWEPYKGVEMLREPKHPEKLKKLIPPPNNAVLRWDGLLEDIPVKRNGRVDFAPIQMPPGTTEFAVDTSGFVAFYSTKHPGMIGLIHYDNRSLNPKTEELHILWLMMPSLPGEESGSPKDDRVVTSITFTEDGRSIEVKEKNGRMWSARPDEDDEAFIWRPIVHEGDRKADSGRKPQLPMLVRASVKKRYPQKTPPVREAPVPVRMLLRPDGTRGALDKDGNLLILRLNGTWEYAPLGTPTEFEEFFNQFKAKERGGWNVVGLGAIPGYGAQNQFAGVKDGPLWAYFLPNMIIPDYAGQSLSDRHKQWWNAHYKYTRKDRSEHVRDDIKISHAVLSEFVKNSGATPKVDETLLEEVNRRCQSLLSEIENLIEMDAPQVPRKPKTTREVAILKNKRDWTLKKGVLHEIQIKGGPAKEFPPVQLPPSTYKYAVATDGSVAFLSKDHPGQIGYLHHSLRRNAGSDNGAAAETIDPSDKIVWMGVPGAFQSAKNMLAGKMPEMEMGNLRVADWMPDKNPSFVDIPVQGGHKVATISFTDEGEIVLRAKNGEGWQIQPHIATSEDPLGAAEPKENEPIKWTMTPTRKVPRSNAITKRLPPSMLAEINALRTRKNTYKNFSASPARVNSNDNVLFVLREARRRLLPEDDSITNQLTALLANNKFMPVDYNTKFTAQDGRVTAHVNNFANLSGELVVWHRALLASATLQGALAEKTEVDNKAEDEKKAVLAETTEAADEPASARAEESDGKQSPIQPGANTPDSDSDPGSDIGIDTKLDLVPRELKDALYLLQRYNNNQIYDLRVLEGGSETIAYFRAALNKEKPAQKVVRAMTAQGKLGVRLGKYVEEKTYGFANWREAWSHFLQMMPVGTSVTLKTKMQGGLDMEGMSQFLKPVKDRKILPGLTKATHIAANVQQFGIEPVNQISKAVEHSIKFASKEKIEEVTFGSSKSLNMLLLAFKLQYGLGFSYKVGDTVFFMYGGNNVKCKIGITFNADGTWTFSYAKEDRAAAMEFINNILNGDFTHASVVENAEEDFTAAKSNITTTTFNLDIEPLLASGIVGDPVHHNFSTIGKLIVAPAVEQLNLQADITKGVNIVMGGNSTTVEVKGQKTWRVGWTHISVLELQGVPNTYQPKSYEDQQKVPVWIMVAQRELLGKALKQDGFKIRVNNKTRSVEGVGITVTAAPHAVRKSETLSQFDETYLQHNKDVTKENIPALMQLLYKHPEVEDLLEKLKKSGSPIKIEMELVPEMLEAVDAIVKHTSRDPESLAALGPEVHLAIAALMRHPGNVRIKRISIDETRSYTTTASSGLSAARYLSEASITKASEPAWIDIVYPENPQAPAQVVPGGSLAQVVNVPDIDQIKRIYRTGSDLWDFVNNPIGGNQSRKKMALSINDALMKLRAASSLLSNQGPLPPLNFNEAGEDEELASLMKKLGGGSNATDIGETGSTADRSGHSVAEPAAQAADAIDPLEEHWNALNTEEWRETKAALRAFFPGSDSGLDRQKILLLLNDAKALLTFMLNICLETGGTLPPGALALEEMAALPDPADKEKERPSTYARLKKLFRSDKKAVEEVAEQRSDQEPRGESVTSPVRTQSPTATGSSGAVSRAGQQSTTMSVVGGTMPGLESRPGVVISRLATHMDATPRPSDTSILTTAGGSAGSIGRLSDLGSTFSLWARPDPANDGNVPPRTAVEATGTRVTVGQWAVPGAEVGHRASRATLPRPQLEIIPATPPRSTTPEPATAGGSTGGLTPTSPTARASSQRLRATRDIPSSINTWLSTRHAQRTDGSLAAPQPGSLYFELFKELNRALPDQYQNAEAMREAVVETLLGSESGRTAIAAQWAALQSQAMAPQSRPNLDTFLAALGGSGNLDGTGRDLLITSIATALEVTLTVRETRDGATHRYDPTADISTPLTIEYRDGRYTSPS